MVPSRIRIAAGAAAVLIALSLLWLKHQSPDTKSHTPAPSPEATRPALQALHEPNRAPNAPATPSAGLAAGSEPLTAFGQWATVYRTAPDGEKASLLEQGVTLARERRSTLKHLIVADPREALARAVPMVVRQDLPPEVVALLEERVNARGFYGVKGTVGGDAAPVRREVRLADDQRYDAYVFGRRVRQATTEVAYLSGIAVDRSLALDERPLRVLEIGERLSGGKPVVETCPISGKTTNIEQVDGVTPPITEETPAVELGGTIQYLCSGGHIAAVEDDALAQEGSTGGAGRPTGGIPATWNTGAKTHLYIRVTFPDQLTDPQNEASCFDMMKSVNDFILENSFGKCYFLTTVTPLLILPRTEAWYVQEDDDGAVLADARLVAKAAGYDPAQYDFDTVRYSGGPGSFGGQAFVHGKGCWLKSSSVGTACHEYGHNLGLWHANYWNTTPASVIGPGANSEYGNSFDTMGAANAGNNHFGAYNKNVINWLTNELVSTVTANGTYRIYAMDQLIADPARRYALKIRKDTDRNYWAEFRQKFTSNIWMMSGLQLTWDSWGDDAATGSNGGPQLLDTTPGSPDGKNDAQLVIGRTFSDLESGIHITPIGKGGTIPESLDVVVNLGAYPTNQAPTLSLSASVSNFAVNSPVTFSAAANDPDADNLAYAWDFGDRTFSTTNAAVVAKSWNTAGIYTVRCTASDMKGKATTSFVVVTVGSPVTFTLGGRITAAGEPLEGVLVSNGQTGTAYRGTYTDSAGYYTVSNLASGSTTLTAQRFGYTFSAGFTNPVAVGPSATGKDFTATAIASLSISAVDPTALEGGDTGTFRITRAGSTSSSLTVRLFAPSGTATITSDYTLSPNPVSNLGVYEVSMPTGAATLNVVVTPVNDATQEGPETVTLQLVPVAGYIITGSQGATVVLDDNDTTLPRVSITAPDEYGNESGDPGQFVFTRTGSTAAALTVQFARSGTAGNASDYANINTTIVIPAGASSVALPIAPIDDSAVEGNETVTVTISSIATYVRDSTAQAATVTINDNDVNILTVVASDNTANESGDTGTFTITRTGDLANAQTVDYVLGGTSLHGADYQKLSGAATILAGEASTTVTIVPIDDAIGEPQQTVILQLRSGTGTQLGSPASATLNLSDNDLPAISVTEYDGEAVEPASGSGTDTARFRIYRTGGSSAFTVNYTISGTATSGSDFTAVSSSVAFTGTDATKDITITALADSVIENAETVTLTLTPNPSVYGVEPESSATVQILDNDQVAVSVSTEEVTVSETSAAMRFWVSRSGSTTGALVVSIQMSGTATEGVDYTASAATITIPATAAGVYVSLPIVNDTIAEGTESVTMNIVPVTGTYGTHVESATYLLADNDTAGLPQLRFNASSSSGAEGLATVNIPVTLSAASATAVTVAYAMNGGSATGFDVDYTLVNGVLQFEPGTTSLTIPITIIDDVFPESNESIAVTLSAANGATLGTSTHTYTINDNDAPDPIAVGFAGASSALLENVLAPTSPVVSLSAPAVAPVTVDYAVTGGSAIAPDDYALASGTLSFAVGDVAKHLPLSVVEDSVAESNETIIVTLSNAVGAGLGANAIHTLTITDNDASTITIAAGDDTAAESGDAGAFTFTRSGSTTGTLLVNLAVTGTATNGADYQTLAATVSFANGQSSITVPVTPYLDSLAEGDEIVTLSVLAGANYTTGAAGSATVTITESGTLVGISASGPIASETGPDPGVFTITRSGDTSAALSVNVTLSGAAVIDSDYTAPLLPITIPAGASSATLNITPIDDLAAESAETVIATLSPNADFTIAAPGYATLSIADNDSNTAPVITRLSPSSGSIGVPTGIGLILETTVTDDGKPANPGSVVTSWTRQSGPGTVTFGSPSQPNTTARFSTNGLYLLRLTATDGALSSTLDVSVGVGGAPAFTGQNVNGSVPAGNFTLANGTYTVRGGGSNITGSSDQFFYLQQSIPGDGEIRARLVSMTGGLSSAKAGVMFRNDLGGGARMAYMASYGPASTSNANTFRTRATDGAAIVNTGNSGAPTYPLWVRVVRSGDSFSGYTSSNGQTWTQIGSATQVTTNAQLYAGLAVTSNDTGNLVTAVFDNVSLSTWPSNLGAAVEAGPEASVNLPGQTTLNGSASDDGKPQPPGAFTVAWSQVSGTGTVTFGNPAAAATTATVSEPGDYVVRLTADDGEVKTFDDTTLTTSQPVVTVAASDASASELGLGTGTFTLTRTGSTASPLTVEFTASGTATSEEDYVALPPTAVIGAGQSSTTITVTPLADTEAEGAESVQLTVVANSAYGVGAPVSATVTLDDLPMDAWRFSVFGTDANTALISGDLVDADGDGLVNLLERAQGTSPLTAETTRPELGFEPGFLTLTYRRSLAASDLTFAVLETPDFATWLPANPAEEVVSDDGIIRVIKARVPVGTGEQKLIRLRITR